MTNVKSIEKSKEAKFENLKFGKKIKMYFKSFIAFVCDTRAIQMQLILSIKELQVACKAMEHNRHIRPGRSFLRPVFPNHIFRRTSGF